MWLELASWSLGFRVVGSSDYQPRELTCHDRSHDDLDVTVDPKRESDGNARSNGPGGCNPRGGRVEIIELEITNGLVQQSLPARRMFRALSLLPGGRYVNSSFASVKELWFAARLSRSSSVNSK